MNIIEIIEKKKKAQELSADEIKFFINGILDGSVKDYQASSLLMAICLRGLNSREIYDLTMAMRDSGDVLDLSAIGDTVVDKHSTGGVGDKTTLIIGPVMASLGVPVAKMSGRGLGITGGTIDKLDSIPGFSSDLTDEAFIRQVKSVGMVDAAQNKNLAPADKYLYALRDVTGTVDSMGLIASSIMSKKLASGADAIVLDIKCGNGAFMKDAASARELACTMIDIARRADKRCTAVITDMNQPLGYTVGNLLEVQEAAEFLCGKRREKRLTELIICLCREMYRLSGRYPALYGENLQFRTGLEEEYKSFLDTKIEKMILDVLNSGKAYEKFKSFIKAQGGVTDSGDASYDYMAHYDGFAAEYRFTASEYIDENSMKSDTGDAPAVIVSRIDAEKTGRISLLLGAGRMTKEDEIDYKAGIVFDKLVGDVVKPGEQVAVLYSKDKAKLEQALQMMKEAVEYKSISDAVDCNSEADLAADKIIIDILT